jgi:hypothetical protein
MAKYRVKELRYRMSPKRRAYLARWWQSPAGRAISRANTKRYGKTAQGRAQKARWLRTAKGRAMQQRWYQSTAFRALQRAQGAKRRARTYGATICESVDRRKIFALDLGLCHLCDRPVDPQRFHVDHLIPLRVEAIEAAFNSAVTHPACNIRKHARFGQELLSPTARARWQERRPEDLAALDGHVARIVAARSVETAA